LRLVYVGPTAVEAGGSLGTRRKMSLISEVLAELCHDVILVSTFRTDGRHQEGWCEFSLRKTTIKCLNVGLLSQPPVAIAIAECVRASRIADAILAECRPDVVLVYNTYLLEALIASAVARRSQAPLVVEVEDLPLARRRGGLNVKPLLDWAAWHRLIPRAAGFIAVSKRVADSLPQRKPRVVLPGILDTDLLDLSQRRPRPFSGSRRIVGYFGMLETCKGADILLAASAQLPANWQLMVTGSGTLSSSFSKASYALPESLAYLGHVNDLRLYELMCSCDVLLIPPEFVNAESVFPFKCLEYLVSGTHVISAHSSMLADPDLAFMVRWDGTVEHLLQEIQSAEANYQRETGQRTSAIRHAVREFSPSSVGNKLTHLLSRVTGLPAASPFDQTPQ
jgi:glycosyltransferase involved in cell wall biosynthesis